jgi:RNA-splicing ligase RtcB
MRDGLIIGVGRGNNDWNSSAPHGAGRAMGRGEAKRKLSVKEFERVMQESGVWSSCVSDDTLDESPMAYKDPQMVQASLTETVDVLYTVKPVYNFKAK